MLVRTPRWRRLQQPIIVLSRNGKDFKVTANQSTVRAGTEIRVKTERPEVPIGLTEMAKDSWVVFELPGFANAASGSSRTASTPCARRPRLRISRVRMPSG